MHAYSCTSGFFFRVIVRPFVSSSRALGTIVMHHVGHTIAHIEHPMHSSSRTAIRPRKPSGTGTFWAGYRIVAGFGRRVRARSRTTPPRLLPPPPVGGGGRTDAEGNAKRASHPPGGGAGDPRPRPRHDLRLRLRDVERRPLELR